MNICTGIWPMQIAPPCTQNEVCPPGVRVTAECFALCWPRLLIPNTWRLANHTVVSCVSSLQTRLSVCSAPKACLFASFSLQCLHPQLPLPDCTQCSHANAAMYRSPVLFPPAARATPACSVLLSTSRQEMPLHAARRNAGLILWRRRKAPLAAQHHHIRVLVGLKGKFNSLPLPHVNHPSQPLHPVERCDDGGTDC